MPVGAGTVASARPANAVRWAWGNADGQLVNKPGRLYYARLVCPVATAVEVVAVLRDGTGATAKPVLALRTGPALGPDDWPAVPVSMGFAVGLYVTFVGGAAADRLLSVGWETD